MRIGVDARALYKRSGGIGVYLQHLLQHFAELDQDNEYVLFLDEEPPSGLGSLGLARFETRVIRLPLTKNLTAWNNLRLPPELWRRPVDLFHFPFYTLPLLKPRRSVVTMADITYRVHPEWFNWKGWLTFRPFSRWAARVADGIITISNASREDILRCYRPKESKVHVIYLGVAEVFRPAPDAGVLAPTEARFQLRHPLILYVGSITLRKNLVRLVQAFHMLVRRRGVDAHLLLVGRPLSPCPDLAALVRELDIEDRVSFLAEHLSPEQLRQLYCLADLFVYPSLYEGFGLPPLESMACGTPVVTSRVSALPEVCGDAAILVDPYSVGEIAEALFEGLTNGTLRTELVARGFDQARRFSWRRAAQETLAVYRAVLEA